MYGLSGKHVEQGQRSPFNKGWPRKLASSCGIAESEQYRYVAMSSDPSRPIDWSHEREWRWVDHGDKCSCPGLPIWLSEEPSSFSRVFVVVPDSADAMRVLDRLKELHDAGANDYGYPFSRAVLEATSVIALDKVERDCAAGGEKTLRLEDIPTSNIAHFTRPKAPPELVNEVRSVLAEAKTAADDAAAARAELAPRMIISLTLLDGLGWLSMMPSLRWCQPYFNWGKRTLFRESDIAFATLVDWAGRKNRHCHWRRQLSRRHGMCSRNTFRTRRSGLRQSGIEFDEPNAVAVVLAEGHLNRKLFAQMFGWPAALPVP